MVNEYAWFHELDLKWDKLENASVHDKNGDFGVAADKDLSKTIGKCA